MLQETLSKKIPTWQEDLKKILDENGTKVISEVTIAQAAKGMRGVKSMICDTSAVSADEGLIIRGHPILQIIDKLQQLLVGINFISMPFGMEILIIKQLNLELDFGRMDLQ